MKITFKDVAYTFLGIFYVVFFMIFIALIDGMQNGKILIYNKSTNQIEKNQLDPNYIEPITDMLMINDDTFICSSRVLSINKIT